MKVDLLKRKTVLLLFVLIVLLVAVNATGLPLHSPVQTRGDRETDG